MSNIIEITENKFSEYRDIQDSGMFNMFDPRAREMTSLTKNEWVHIITNYNELKEKFGGGK